VRLIGLPGDVGVANLITASHTQDAIQHDYVSLANLKVWHSHFPLYGITPAVNNNGTQINAAGDLCPGGNPESGGDAGGANVLKQANFDFCTDYGSLTGLNNKTN
jgi:hypothetical protein